MIGGRGGTASAKARREKTLKIVGCLPRLIAESRPLDIFCQLRATNLPRFYAPDLASTRVCVTSKPAVTGESLVHVTGSNACASGKAECVRALSWYTPAVRPRGRNPRFLFSPVVPKLVTVCPYVPNLTQRDGTGAVPMGFLDAAGGGGGLARRLGGELLTGVLATGGLTRRLFGSCQRERRVGGDGTAPAKKKKVNVGWLGPVLALIRSSGLLHCCTLAS